MIRLKRKAASSEEKKEEKTVVSDDAMVIESEGNASTGNSASEPAAPAKAEPAPAQSDNKGQVKILGFGRGRKGAKKTGKKCTPGEIRIQKDVAELDSGTVATVDFPNPDNLTEFIVTVKPDTGLWSGATYPFTFKIPALYPHEPPKVHCETRIYHPNIDLQGNVCLNILREDWKPVLDINAVIYGLIYLFYEPNPDDPLNREAADLFRSNYSNFERQVQRTLRGGTHMGETFKQLI